jgi:hypothetical protein
MWERRGAYRVSVGKHKRKMPPRRPRYIWEDNIKKDFQKMEWGHGLIHLAQDRNRWRALVNTVMNLRVSIKCGEFLD